MTFKIESVAVIGAGVSGVSAATHLKAAGLQVTLFERTGKAGGVWVYDDRPALEPSYPSMVPSVGDSPLLNASDVPRDTWADSTQQYTDPTASRALERLISSPGPCYRGLMNNVSTVEMELQVQPWKPGTPEFVFNDVLAGYIQNVAQKINGNIHYNTLIRKVEKIGSKWLVESSKLDPSTPSRLLHNIEASEFDAVVVANGHYHHARIPDIPGLKQWKQEQPNRVHHSKSYRSPTELKDQTVLLIGAGVSSTDIAKELGTVAKRVYQSSRGGVYDLPAAFLPDNAVRIGAIKHFENRLSIDSATQNQVQRAVHLEDGHELCDIDTVIICTGYMISYPFLRPFHDDETSAEDASDKVLVTADGSQTHNLHKDIFYIPDPTLSFIGVPYHVATFSLYEFQAIALSAVYSGVATLPSLLAMREEYRMKIVEKGAGRSFHSLLKDGAEISYVRDLTDWINANRPDNEFQHGHTTRWLEAYKRRLRRRDAQKALVGTSNAQRLGGHSFITCT